MPDRHDHDDAECGAGNRIHVPRAMMIDLGDTLLQLNRYDLIAGVRALAPGAGEEGVRRAAALLELRILARYAEGWREYRLADHLEWLAGELGVAAPGDPEAVFWDATVTLSPMHGVRSALETLRSRGTELCVVSNTIFSGRILNRELERHGLSEFMSFVISSADHGHRKPHPSIFRAALERLGMGPEQVWYVGDSWDCDVCGAAVSGLVPVWFTTTSGVRSETLRHLRVAAWEEVAARAVRAGG